MNRTCLIVLSLLTLLINGGLRSQDLNGVVEQLAQEAARAYVRPVVSGFGANVNSAWFHRTPKATKFSFDFEFGMVFMGTFFNKNEKHFSVGTQYTLTQDDAQGLAQTLVYNDPNFSGLSQSQKDAAIAFFVDQLKGRQIDVNIGGATVIGAEDDSVGIAVGQDLTVDYLGQTYNFNGVNRTLPFGGLLNSPFVPLFAPQVTFGTIMGSQVTVRYLPPVNVKKDIGKVYYFGFGIQHNPGVWFHDPLPVDVALAYYTQKMKRGSFFESTAHAFGLTASKQLGIRFLNVTPYAGFLVESSRMKFKYDYTYDLGQGAGIQTSRIAFTEKGNNKNRFTIGTNVRVLTINLNADYSFSKNNTVTVGVNFAI